MLAVGADHHGRALRGVRHTVTTPAC
jgi:hypothetical protein